MAKNTEIDLAIVGGCGHAGLPLGIALASADIRTVLYDVDQDAVDSVNSATMPFLEHGADEELSNVIASSMLKATIDPSSIRGAETVIVVIGTPVNQYLNPDLTAVQNAIEDILPFMSDGQLVVLRSTIFPGITRTIERMMIGAGLDIDIAFCPERTAEGHALRELRELPQIVAGCTKRAEERAASLFSNLAPKILFLEPEEAEVAKLITNSWRYIKFATANQFYMLANDYGLDYDRIRSAVVEDYPRAADLPRAGFAAGPCLLKDTMQLAAYNNNDFLFGQASMNINEGLPLYVVSKLADRFDLENMTVGILGMAFKADTDDARWSLSYKLRRILQFRARGVLCTDPFVDDDQLVDLDTVLEQSDLIIVGAPHSVYRGLDPWQPVADVWGILDRGVRI